MLHHPERNRTVRPGGKDGEMRSVKERYLISESISSHQPSPLFVASVKSSCNCPEKRKKKKENKGGRKEIPSCCRCCKRVFQALGAAEPSEERPAARFLNERKLRDQKSLGGLKHVPTLERNSDEIYKCPKHANLINNALTTSGTA